MIYQVKANSHSFASLQFIEIVADYINSHVVTIDGKQYVSYEDIRTALLNAVDNKKENV